MRKTSYFSLWYQNNRYFFCSTGFQFRYLLLVLFDKQTLPKLYQNDWLQDKIYSLLFFAFFFNQGKEYEAKTCQTRASVLHKARISVDNCGDVDGMIVERKGRLWRLQQWNVFLMCLFLLLKRSIWDLLSQNERQVARELKEVWLIEHFRNQ